MVMPVRVGALARRLRPRGFHVFEFEMPLDLRGVVGFSIHFHVGINEKVDRRPILGRRQYEVATGAERHAIGIKMAEEVISFCGVLVRFRNIYRHPAMTLRLEKRPTVVSCDLTFATLLW